MRPGPVKVISASASNALLEFAHWLGNESSAVIPEAEDIGIACDSVDDVFVYLVRNGMWDRVLLNVAISVAILGTLTLASFYLGSGVKPRAPLYWKFCSFNPWSDDFEAEVDVTKELLEPVQRLLDLTTVREYMGQGRDGAWATHRGLKVLKVTRIENGKLWSGYAKTKLAVAPVAKMMRSMSAPWRAYCQKTVNAIQEVHEDREQDPLVKNFIRSLRLDEDRNERLLFHGSPGKGARQQSTGLVLFEKDSQSPVFSIKRGGFDDRLGNVKGMYGSGTYFADHASKADQYAGQYNPPGTSGGSVGEVATMFLCRVVLGCPYRTDQSLEQLRRPPCVQGHFDLNLSWNEEVQFGKPWRDKGLAFQICDHSRFDSVMGDFVIDGKIKNYREFVVYDRQCYPEFCVRYERTA